MFHCVKFKWLMEENFNRTKGRAIWLVNKCLLGFNVVNFLFAICIIQGLFFGLNLISFEGKKPSSVILFISHLMFCCNTFSFVGVHISLFFLSRFEYNSNVFIWLLPVVSIFLSLRSVFLYTRFLLPLLTCLSIYLWWEIREVATLSRLQHQHVVRYYQVHTFLFCAPITNLLIIETFCVSWISSLISFCFCINCIFYYVDHPPWYFGYGNL